MNVEIVRSLLLKLDTIKNPNVIHWGSPIVAFGDLSVAKVATIGLNPSDKEFLNNSGLELENDQRRFETLHSLKIKSWQEATDSDIRKIIQTYTKYFQKNPYTNWFNRLEYIISDTGYSYKKQAQHMCHLDLVPYATSKKWGLLKPLEKKNLIEMSCVDLALTIKESSITTIIMNGKSVVDSLSLIIDQEFKEELHTEWSLPRKSGYDVKGFSYFAKIKNIAGIELNREVLFLGFNHNIQSSFGVTKEVIDSIKNWIGKEVCHFEKK